MLTIKIRAYVWIICFISEYLCHASNFSWSWNYAIQFHASAKTHFLWEIYSALSTYHGKYAEVFFQSKEQQEKARQEDVKKCDQYIRLYVDLCSEEYFLYTQHCIDDVVWKEWEEGILWAFTENEIVKNIGQIKTIVQVILDLAIM